MTANQTGAQKFSQWRIATSPSSGALPFKLLLGECLIAEISPCATFGSGIDDEQTLALINAAPELLAALEAIEKANAAYGLAVVSEIARAAIAKAKGTTP